jgi:hypothetical protein
MMLVFFNSKDENLAGNRMHFQNSEGKIISNLDVY